MQVTTKGETKVTRSWDSTNKKFTAEKITPAGEAQKRKRLARADFIRNNKASLKKTLDDLVETETRKGVYTEFMDKLSNTDGFPEDDTSLF